ncbi:MAG: cupredoxin domain-containing protein [Gemmatimonadota bacterium]|nr:cupredoxin domain-containing protein [Gemmatimonadota bacterium]
MTPIEWMVILGGLAAIVWVNWYFFLATGGGVSTAMGSGGAQEVTITVRGGYEPSNVRVKKGAPVRLIFDRQETSGCSEEVVFPDFGIRKFLPAHKRTTIELTPDRAGSYDFTCGMSMLRGKITVEDDKEE